MYPYISILLNESERREAEDALFDMEARSRGYVPERTGRNTYEGREFECSECGTQWHLLVREDAVTEWAHVRTPNCCPECGVRLVKE